VAAIVLILLVNYVVSPVKIKGRSMYPVLKDKERILISKLNLNKEHIKRFDIIVFTNPREKGKRFIKRIIGLPGETITIKNGEVYINSRKIEQVFISQEMSDNFQAVNMKPREIPEDFYFLIGDNRQISRDSRTYGVVHRDNILGKAIFRYWPFSRFGKIQ
jgi:signal peptidase I